MRPLSRCRRLHIGPPCAWLRLVKQWYVGFMSAGKKCIQRTFTHSEGSSCSSLDLCSVPWCHCQVRQTCTWGPLGWRAEHWAAEGRHLLAPLPRPSVLWENGQRKRGRREAQSFAASWWLPIIGTLAATHGQLETLHTRTEIGNIAQKRKQPKAKLSKRCTVCVCVYQRRPIPCAWTHRPEGGQEEPTQCMQDAEDWCQASWSEYFGNYLQNSRESRGRGCVQELVVLVPQRWIHRLVSEIKEAQSFLRPSWTIVPSGRCWRRKGGTRHPPHENPTLHGEGEGYPVQIDQKFVCREQQGIHVGGWTQAARVLQDCYFAEVAISSWTGDVVSFWHPQPSCVCLSRITTTQRDMACGDRKTSLHEQAVLHSRDCGAASDDSSERFVELWIDASKCAWGCVSAQRFQKDGPPRPIAVCDGTFNSTENALARVVRSPWLVGPHRPFDNTFQSEILWATQEIAQSTRISPDGAWISRSRYSDQVKLTWIKVPENVLADAVSWNPQNRFEFSSPVPCHAGRSGTDTHAQMVCDALRTGKNGTHSKTWWRRWRDVAATKGHVAPSQRLENKQQSLCTTRRRM